MRLLSDEPAFTTGPVPAPVVIIGCGATKRAVRAPAAELYVGSLFVSARRAAQALAPSSRILILSALHGLLRFDQPVDPYDKRLDDPGAVTAADVGRQARGLGILGCPVIALASRDYVDLCRQVWPVVAAPIYGMMIGNARHELAGITQRGSLH